MTIPAGWYADESMPGFDRYWDGTWWTAETRESANLCTTSPSPPSKPPMIDKQSPESKPRTYSLTLNRKQLILTLGEMMDRSNTVPVVLKIYDASDETLRMVDEILELHDSNAGRGVIRPKIQSLVAWQQEQVHPSLKQLGMAMEEDFNLLVKELGGPLLLPVPIDRAWENYVAPIKGIVGQIEQDESAALQKIAEIEDRYLYI